MLCYIYTFLFDPRYQQYSSCCCLYERNLERQNVAKSIPKQEFEIDLTVTVSDVKEDESRLKQISELLSQHPPLAEDEDITSVFYLKKDFNLFSIL